MPIKLAEKSESSKNLVSLITKSDV